MRTGVSCFEDEDQEKIKQHLQAFAGPADGKNETVRARSLR